MEPCHLEFQSCISTEMQQPGKTAVVPFLSLFPSLINFDPQIYREIFLIFGCCFFFFSQSDSSKNLEACSWRQNISYKGVENN